MFRFLPVSLIAIFLATTSFAFDSNAWLMKREVLTREAERLKAAYAKVTAEATKPAEDLLIPLETYDNGEVKTIITAKRAQFFLKTGFVWAEGVNVRKMDEDGEVSSEIIAKHCLIDRQMKSGWAEGEATVRHGRTTMKGKGVFFSSPESYVKILSEAEIESSDLKFGEARR